MDKDREQLMVVFRDRLNGVIKDKNLSLKTLAQQVGVSLSAMYQYTHEKKGILPSVEILYKLVTALGVSADYLLGLVDYPNAIVSAQEDPETKEEIELIRRAYKKMTERELNVIRGLVADIIEQEEDEKLKRYMQRKQPKVRIFKLIRGGESN